MSGSILEYLTNVLSQRGPTAVPYDENVKWNIRDHVAELQKVFPTLNSKLSEYHSNDGRLLHVLKVEGTMPIHYQGAKYNIPILMWLAERYPFSPPQIFVVPTANMIIRPGTFVNPSGQVSTPLLQTWLFPSSNLVDVVLEMSQYFSREPPLYTRPAGYTPPPTSQTPAVVYPPPNYPVPHGSAAATPGSVGNGYVSSAYPGASTTTTPYATPTMGNTPSSTPGTTAAGPGPAPAPGWLSSAGLNAPYSAGGMPPPPPPPPPPQGPFGFGNIFGGLFGAGGQQAQPPPPASHPQQSVAPPPAGGSSSSQLSAAASEPPPPPPPPPPPAEPARPAVSRQELEVHFRHLAVEALAAQLRALQHSFGEHAEKETEKALEVQGQLGERRAQLQATLDALTQQRMSTEQQVSELASKTKALQTWLDRNELRASRYDPEAASVSAHMLPADELSRQGMETQARDLALEDAVLALDKLLQTGQVPLEAYLKQVRSLCRKQFFSRALGLKVAEVQQSRPQPPQPAAPGSARHHHTTAPYPMAHGDGWSHGAPPPPSADLRGAGLMPSPGGMGAVGGPGLGGSTGILTNPLAGR